MDVAWAETPADTGRFTPVERISSADDFDAQLTAWQQHGEGYFEVRRAGVDFPYLTVGFRSGLAVTQLGADPESMSLLAGDGSAPGDELVEVPIMDDDAAFTGEFVTSVERAWSVTRAFVRGAEPEALGDWAEL